MSELVRMEKDVMGLVTVSAQALWGASTQRALGHFDISTERMPLALLMALADIKKIGAQVNAALGLLDHTVAAAIADAADEVLAGVHDDAFPLMVWQSGSGTQTHMNMNEVLANRASVLLGGVMGEGRCVHVADQVNMGQSSNDVMPTAMHLAAVRSLCLGVLPAVRVLRETLMAKSSAFASLVKIGRTHLQDATPLTVGQEVSGWAAQLAHAEHGINLSLDALYELAIGGTAVGTGLNTHPDFGRLVAQALAQADDLPWRCAPNRFAAMAAHDGLVSAHGALKTLAVALMKIANDVRWLASGPRCGIGELVLPDNEPGSSIMPGKVNPTQCEALTMVCCQVMGNDVAIALGGSGGQFELNAYKPLIAYNFLQSARLLGDAMVHFERYCVRGLEVDVSRLADLMGRSLMLVTALSPHIGYDRAAKIAHHAHVHNLSLREAALGLGEVSEADFDQWVRPEQMI
jgi:fumarate hydratase class II